jgi:hypothetical protein
MANEYYGPYTDKFKLLSKYTLSARLNGGCPVTLAELAKKYPKNGGVRKAINCIGFFLNKRPFRETYGQRSILMFFNVEIHILVSYSIILMNKYAFLITHESERGSEYFHETFVQYIIFIDFL